MFIDTHGLFQDTMIRIRMETGIWIKRTDSSKTTAQSSQKLAEFITLCDYSFLALGKSSKFFFDICHTRGGEIGSSSHQKKKKILFQNCLKLDSRECIFGSFFLRLPLNIKDILETLSR